MQVKLRITVSQDDSCVADKLEEKYSPSLKENEKIQKLQQVIKAA